MSIYRRDDVLPEWEPIPWTARGPVADEQERGFHERALKPLVWTRVRWHDFPAEGVLGYDREWFLRQDIDSVATFDGEDLILIRNTWHDFPDPPEWGLGSRAAGCVDAPWQMWGHFPQLPAAWQRPDPA